MLVLDDDARILRTVARLLRPRHRVTTLARASEALALLAVTRFDAIVCDQQMPEMTGATMVSHLSARDAARVVFMTGGEGVVHNGFPVTNLVLCKPFTKTELLSAIESVFDATESAEP